MGGDVGLGGSVTISGHQLTFLGLKRSRFKPLARCFSPSTPTPTGVTGGKERLNTYSIFWFVFNGLYFVEWFWVHSETEESTEIPI